MPLTLPGWLQQEFATIPQLTPWLFGLALLISASGFYRTVYFVSIGYAFSIAAMAVTTLLVFRQDLDWFDLLQNVCLAVYGLRLGIYLLRREAKSSFSKERESITAAHRRPHLWPQDPDVDRRLAPVCHDVLAQPVQPDNRAARPAPAATVLQLLGLAIMFGGLGLEAWPTHRSPASRRGIPGDTATCGLYRRIRCPNYFGEIMVWVGNWVLGFVFYTSALQWIASFAGLVCIVLIMMGSTKRLEQAQDDRYGAQPAYQEYTRTVPVLFPLRAGVLAETRARCFLNDSQRHKICGEGRRLSGWCAAPECPTPAICETPYRPKALR